MRLYKVAYYNLSGCHERPYGGLTIKFYPECLLFEDVRWSSDWDFAMVQSQPKLDWGHDPSHGRERRELLSCSWTRYTGKKYFETVSREATTRLETCLYDGKWVDMAETDSLTGNLCDMSSSKTLRLSGTVVFPRFTLRQGKLYANIRTEGENRELRLESSWTPTRSHLKICATYLLSPAKT
jgi:hypothetical protein